MATVWSSQLAPASAEVYAGELANFNSAAALYRPKIFRYILASLRDKDAAETLTQDCLVKAFKARSSFRGDASVSTWLMQIAVNLVRDYTRNTKLMFWRKAGRESVDLNVAGEWLADQQKSPEALALAKERVATIWRAAAQLPEKQRMVFLLRFVEDMEILEIVAATGLKEGTVKAHLFRALQTVRLRIEEKK
jgi:RNA polymerase sigma-70 factor (ECF subfamily)